MSQESEPGKQDEIFRLLRRFLAFRERSEYEVRSLLLKKGFSSKCVEDAIVKLKENGIVDDRRFARHYISDAMKLSKKGFVRIRRELERLGIAREELEDLLSDEKLQDEADEILKKEIRKLGRDLDLTPANRKRLVDKLLRKGFEYERIAAELSRYRSD